MATAEAASSSRGSEREGKKKEAVASVVVDWGRRRSSCGYCSSSSSSSVSHGVWAYSLTASDYQELLDRGWRRSGCYVYKPEMHKTCCPQYTIRLKASNFTPSKEQDRVLKRMQRYLDGELDSKSDKSNAKSKSNLKEANNKPNDSHLPNNTENQDTLISFLSDKINNAVNTFFEGRGILATNQTPKSVVKKVKPQIKSKLKGIVTREEDLVYTCNVSFQIASYIRKSDAKAENSNPVSPITVAEELEALIITSEEISGFIIKACNGYLNFYTNAKPENAPVEESVQAKQPEKKNNGNTPEKRRKKLEIRMKRSEFDPEEYALYKKYQTLVHQDKRISKDSYTRFLVDTPIPFVDPDGSSIIPLCGFGSFHQQYLMDGKLIAVGVVDILPKCLSSKYLFWDPDFAFLSLGKFTALKEIQWVREMQAHCPSLEYYYLGYYIHSCNKMRYKAAYRPSELLCPLRFEWVSYDAAKPLLDRSKYAILSDFRTAESAHGTSSTSDNNMQHSGDMIQNMTEGGENGEEEDFMHEECDVGPDEESASADMDDDDDDDDDEDDEDGREVDASGTTDAESIGDIVLDVHNTHVKFKDLQARFVVKKSFLRMLEKQLYKYMKIVGKDLSSRIVYSLG